jgi:hypothetical protein
MNKLSVYTIVVMDDTPVPSPAADALKPASPSAALDFPIPDDPAEVRRIIVGLNLQRQQAQRERDEQRLAAERFKERAEELEIEKLRLEFELARAHRRLYGPRADQVEDVAQLLLAFGRELERQPLVVAQIHEAAAVDLAAMVSTASLSEECDD